MDETTIAILDRFIEPVRNDITSVNSKLDKVLAIGERVAAVEQHAPRLSKLEADNDKHKTELALVRGRNQVILWLLGLVGAPSLVALVAIGMQHVFK